MSEREHSIFQLQLICSTPRAAALEVIREALSEVGVYINDIRHLSNMASVVHVMLRGERWKNMLDALSSTGASLDPPDAGYPESLKLDEDGDIFGTLQILYASDEPARRDVIPSVPG